LYRSEGGRRTDGFDAASVVLGLIGIVSFVLGCCTCGVGFWAAPVFAGLGLLFGVMSQGSWKAAGLAINLLVLLPVILMGAVAALGAIGVQAPNTERLRDRLKGRTAPAQAKVKSNEPKRTQPATKPAASTPPKRGEPRDIRVESLIVNKIAGGKHRYFFRIRNQDKEPFSGTVKITLLQIGADNPTWEHSFESTNPTEPISGSVVYLECNTGPVRALGEWGIAAFRYEATVNGLLVASGGAPISDSFEDLSR
jgi:hypothetical protein